jgi:hypothetical protein
MGNAGSGLKSKSNAEIDEIFTKFDKDGSGAISSDELQVALSELFNVQMSSSQRGALMASIDTNADGLLQKSEFVGFAQTYEGSLPGGLHFGEPGIQFVSFASDAPIGLTLSVHEVRDNMSHRDLVTQALRSNRHSRAGSARTRSCRASTRPTGPPRTRACRSGV